MDAIDSVIEGKNDVTSVARCFKNNMIQCVNARIGGDHLGLRKKDDDYSKRRRSKQSYKAKKSILASQTQLSRANTNTNTCESIPCDSSIISARIDDYEDDEERKDNRRDGYYDDLIIYNMNNTMNTHTKRIHTYNDSISQLGNNAKIVNNDNTTSMNTNNGNTTNNSGDTDVVQDTTQTARIGLYRRTSLGPNTIVIT